MCNICAYRFMSIFIISIIYICLQLTYSDYIIIQCEAVEQTRACKKIDAKMMMMLILVTKPFYNREFQYRN